MFKHSILTTLVIIAMQPFVWGQDENITPDIDKPWKLNIGVGTANYYGDFVNPGSLGILGPSVNVEAEYNLGKRWSLRSSLGWFTLEGSDINANDSRWQRNLNFKSSSFEWTVTASTLVFDRFDGYNKKRTVYPYAFLGFGLMSNNPTTTYLGDKVKLRPLRTEGIKYSGIQPVIPGGIGFRFMVSNSINIMAEAGYRYTFTDRLDDVSRYRYPEPSTLSSDLSRTLSDRRPEIGTQPSDPTGKGLRGNPERNDGYLLLNLKLQIYLPKKEKEEKSTPAQPTEGSTGRRSKR